MCVQKLDATAPDRQLETDLFSDVWGPCSGAVDNEVGSEDPVGCPHRPDRTGFDVEPDHLDTALDPGACSFGC